MLVDGASFSDLRWSRSDQNDPDLRDLYTQVFSLHGHRVLGIADNGAEAVLLARRFQPDVVLLDVSMPAVSGLEALPLIRRVAPDTAVIMLTALGMQHVAEEAVRLGAHGYIEKGDPRVAVVVAELVLHRCG